MNLIALGKRILPESAKLGAERGIRLAGSLSAGLRPPPDFLVIGTKRGGTTSLWRMLLSHPQVMPMVPKPKNLKSSQFFTAEYRRGPRWFAGHFPTSVARQRHAARHGRALVGEASPNYLWDPRVPERARALLPDARIVVLLRDPVSRAFSHWQERVKQGTEWLSFEEALEAEDGRLAGELDRMLADPAYFSAAYDWYSYRSRGEYAEQVRRWLEVYPAEQVLVLRSEDFYAVPVETAGQITDFLGLDRLPLPRLHWNTSSRTDPPMTEAANQALRAYFAPFNQKLAEILDSEVWWPR